MNDPVPILVPREDVNDEFVCITKWLVAEGSRVEKDQSIVEVETSKANMEISAPASGFLRWGRREGEEVQIGSVIGYLCDKPNDALPSTPTAFNGPRSVQLEIEKSDLQKEFASPLEAMPPGEIKGRGARFSQQALDMIQEWGLDPSQFENIGLVRSQDVLKHVRQEISRNKQPTQPKSSTTDESSVVPAAGVKVTTEKLSRSKRLEAKYLRSAYQHTLPSAVTVRCPAAALHNAGEKQTGIRANASALLLLEVARLLRKYPIFNSYYDSESANYYQEVNIGFAIDAGKGLKVPVIHNADTKDAAEIASEMRELLIQYLEDKIPIQSLNGGTFTITDLSGDAVHSFQPLINQGQAAILAICSEFETENRERMFNLVLVFDHQLSEGRQAARFLHELRHRLEENGKTLQKSNEALTSELKTPPVSPSSATEEELAAIWSEVFGLGKVGIHDNFLELGGHSLLATQLLFLVRKTFQVELPLRSLFEAPTVASLAIIIDAMKGRPSEQISFPAIVPDLDHRNLSFPLTDVQQAYWIGRGSSFDLGNVACHLYTEIEFSEFDQERFERVLQRLIERHDMLRAIVSDDGSQQILQQVPLYRLEVLDLRGQDLDLANSQLKALRGRMSHQVLQTDRWPLFDIRACIIDGRRAQLHVSLDLLIVDARSIHILVQEFTELYANPEAPLAPLAISFRDYVLAEAAFQKSDAYRRSEEYWKSRLPLLPAPPDLPLAKNPNSVKLPHFVRRTARLELGIWRQLKKRATAAGLTAPGLLLAAFAEVVSVWSKSTHFTLNLTLFNRLPLHPQVNDIVGDFTSLTMLSIENSKQDGFQARARRIQEQLWRDLDHRYFSGVRVLRELARTQGESQGTAMPVVFTSFLNLDTPHQESPGSGLGKITYGITQTPQVWLDNIVREEGDTLVSNWDAVEELFPHDVLNEMFSSYERLLMHLASNDSAWSWNLRESTENLLPPNQTTLYHQVNETESVCSNELLHNLFLRHVKERPHHIAVRSKQGQLTYLELYRLACRIEEELLQRSVHPNQLVAVIMEKGWEQIAAVLGIQFAGAAYLPIDPELPAERQQYLLEHGQAKIVLTQSTVKQQLSVPNGIDVLSVDLLKGVEGTPLMPRKRQKAEDLAYVIYTSGSTGFPKGVMIDHRGAVNTVLDINHRFSVGSDDRVLALSRLSFDLSVYDIFGLLAAGGTIVMPDPDRALDTDHWAELMRSEKVTIWDTVPALLQLLVESTPKPDLIGQSLRLVMMSGDWIPVGLPNQIRKLVPSAKIVSLGGATEASIWSILYPIEDVNPEWKSIPYGKPMVNQRFHVLNEALGPCPVWVPGHLYIGGIGLAKGYWRDRQKTEASFVKDPVTGDRLYRTGDLGRYLPDGNIEFLGRDDFQVKVQGHRIELGEIEVRLLEHDLVENCVVVVRTDRPGEKLLVAYVVSRPGTVMDPSVLREHLRLKLPEYMVPSAFISLDRLPLTANGKVDRKALPQPLTGGQKKISADTEPRDLLERQLTMLWEKVLDVHPVRRTDNFFDLGGHSLIALRLFSQLKKLTGRSMALSTLFVAPTVETLADVLRKDGYSPTSFSSLVPIRSAGSRPPFFCVHGAGGNVVMFRDLARRLGDDYPFYGLQSQGLDGSKNYLRSVEEMAGHYLKEIKELQPDGPYYLGGFCMGGQVAYEMAQILRRDGERVAALIMFDTYNFNGVPPRLSFRQGMTQVREKIEFHSVNVLRLDLAAQMTYLSKKVRGAFEREVERLFVRGSNLLKLTPLGGGRRKFEVFLEHLNEEAHFAYVPQPYEGKVTIFKPRKNYSHLRDSEMGWGAVVANGLEIIELPTNPGGLFVEPYVKALADKLRACINEAVRQSDGPSTEGQMAGQIQGDDHSLRNEEDAVAQSK